MCQLFHKSFNYNERSYYINLSLQNNCYEQFYPFLSKLETFCGRIVWNCVNWFVFQTDPSNQSSLPVKICKWRLKTFIRLTLKED